MTATALDFDRCYSAVSTRDPRFDGQFVVAVRSTRIYCRPSCPARTPKPVNCTFYPTSAAAHVAGYRACRRCLPEAVPGSPAWNLREDVAARAMRLIGAGVVDRDGVAGLATRLGYSERQLGRILTSQLGAGPLALARAQRAQTARQLLVSTAMPASDVAFAAGFHSIRQFNDTVAEVFAMTPSQLRGRARRSEHAQGTADGPAPGTITLRLQAREPFRGSDIIAWLAARAIDGLEHAEAGAFSRAVRLSTGAARFTASPAADHVHVTATLAHLADLPELLAMLRRLFDLDADPAAVDAALASDPRLASAVATAPGSRIPGTVDPTEMLARAILGQQVSVTSARTAVQRLVDALGEPLPSSLATDEVRVAFPSAVAIASHAAEVVRGPATRTRALSDAMSAVASGELVLDAGRTLAETTSALEAIPGIGPWTSHYVALRVLTHPDILLTGDSAVRAGARTLGIPSEPRGLAEYAERHRPWRSYVMIHLWRAAALSGTSKET
ncbi:DNA-3-methyladenine glycosylase 2 family protein [Demequina muriae]|uniref:DNA-3-methyladenine glycosylase II n=1 Tax=Demequina muriae TaxID=3051664 RepID=A0ABT8GGV8_9MICO|nr:AlkA N-terminal domain-containing protein [Demequina sp. EGI L300058]MDN4480663.1 AlkA N-terminal domain-containing protein [Demequina sp. EGI L300058]